MQIIWRSTDRFRAFLHDGPTAFCLVSNRVAPGAGNAHVIDNRLVVGVDDDQRFCDLELAFAEPSPLVQLPCVPELADQDEVEALIDENAAVQWRLNRDRLEVEIEIGSGPDNVKWHRLGRNCVWVRTADKGELRGIFCLSAALDPTGQMEAEWLDQIGL